MKVYYLKWLLRDLFYLPIKFQIRQKVLFKIFQLHKTNCGYGVLGIFQKNEISNLIGRISVTSVRPVLKIYNTNISHLKN